jgi:hypothetical protein
MQQAKASTQAAQAVADQNRANQEAQNQGFTARNAAAMQQADTQREVSNQTLAARNQAFDVTRQGQQGAMQRYQEMLDAQNQQAETLRSRGDTASQQLLEATSGQQLADAEERRRMQQEALLAQNMPETEGPTTSDPVERAALARRVAEGATNIRHYGSALARADAYGAPSEEVKLAAADARYGIMPSQAAEKLLTSGSATRLLPSKTQYQQATSMGGAQDVYEQSRGQAGLDTAKLTADNATNIANLAQSNEQRAADNRSAQAQADAAAARAQGAMISSLGNVISYGAGYFGGNPFSATAPAGWVNQPGMGSGIYTNLSTGITSDIPGSGFPGVKGGFLSSLFK